MHFAMDFPECLFMKIYSINFRLFFIDDPALIIVCNLKNVLVFSDLLENIKYVYSDAYNYMMPLCSNNNFKES